MVGARAAREKLDRSPAMQARAAVYPMAHATPQVTSVKRRKATVAGDTENGMSVMMVTATPLRPAAFGSRTR